MSRLKIGVDTTVSKSKDIIRAQANKASQAVAGDGIFLKALVVEVLADPHVLIDKLKEVDNVFKEKISLQHVGVVLYKTPIRFELT